MSRTETKIFSAIVVPDDFEVPRPLYEGRRWAELSDREHQRLPGDYEAQVGQGPITFHSEEHLAGVGQGSHDVATPVPPAGQGGSRGA